MATLPASVPHPSTPSEQLGLTKVKQYVTIRGMCIAIYKPAGKDLRRETRTQCWFRHPDGGGFALPTGKGGLKIRKSMTRGGFEQAWQESARVDRPMIIHFRYATHGARNIASCHPHRVNRQLVMIHNGVISRMVRYATSKKSDTAAFVEKVLSDLSNDTVYTEGGLRLLEKYVGESSKLVFLNGEGRPQIVGETQGVWDGGLWYSNKSYRPGSRYTPRRRYRYTGAKKTTNGKKSKKKRQTPAPLTVSVGDMDRWPEAPDSYYDNGWDDDRFFQSADDGADLYEALSGNRGRQGRFPFDDHAYVPDVDDPFDPYDRYRGRRGGNL